MLYRFRQIVGILILLIRQSGFVTEETIDMEKSSFIRHWLFDEISFLLPLRKIKVLRM